jgi:phosphatidylserine/phosphatidylglycerophosphate/cardiolipin synthase-like enzyme
MRGHRMATRTTRGVGCCSAALAFLLLSLSGAHAVRADGPDVDAVELADASDLAVGPGALTVLPEDGRSIYLRAIDRARRQIRIEICVLEDPRILEGLRAALQRGVRVRAIVDRGKYDELAAERANLGQYLTSAGGELHLSNPVFPRSFPKVILIDGRLVVYGSACLDETTFSHYRDFAHASADPQVLRDLHRLFENDWVHSAPTWADLPPFNPTPRLPQIGGLIVSPVNGAERLVRFFQEARRTLDVYTELLGNPTLEAELVAAVDRGVRVRLISPLEVNGGSQEVQQQQQESLAALAAAGVDLHVSGPQQTRDLPYMHARAAVADGARAYLGSLSLSRDSITFNREVGLLVRDGAVVRGLATQFESDFQLRTRPF